MKSPTEEYRQFTVVCKVALQLGVAGYLNVQCARAKRVSLSRIGMEDFGLTPGQVNSAIGMARDFLSHVHQADRLRKGGMRNKPTTSDKLVEKINLRLVA